MAQRKHVAAKNGWHAASRHGVVARRRFIVLASSKAATKNNVVEGIMHQRNVAL